MGLVPQKFREIVFQLVYINDFHENEPDALTPILMHELKTTKKNISDAYSRAQLVLKHRDEIDSMIRKVSTSYDIHRIHSVERNVLRLSVFELFIEKELPPRVVLSEAKRLARKFGTKEAATFVHALLDALCKVNELDLS